MRNPVQWLVFFAKPRRQSFLTKCLNPHCLILPVGESLGKDWWVTFLPEGMTGSWVLRHRGFVWNAAKGCWGSQTIDLGGFLTQMVMSGLLRSSYLCPMPVCCLQFQALSLSEHNTGSSRLTGIQQLMVPKQQRDPLFSSAQHPRKGFQWPFPLNQALLRGRWYSSWSGFMYALSSSC